MVFTLWHNDLALYSKCDYFTAGSNNKKKTDKAKETSLRIFLKKILFNNIDNVESLHLRMSVYRHLTMHTMHLFKQKSNPLELFHIL